MQLNLRQLITVNLRIIMVPVVLFITLGILVIFSVQFGFGKISEQNAQLQKAKADEDVLVQKESVLRNIQPVVEKYINSVALAVTEENPALLVISQLKSEAQKQGIIITDIKIGLGSSTAEKLNMNSTEVGFSMDGSVSQIISFLKSLDKLLPIIKVNQVKFVVSSGVARSEIQVKSYYASYPTKLPSLTEPIKELTKGENDILESISLMTKPFFNELSPQSATVRENPF